MLPNIHRRSPRSPSTSLFSSSPNSGRKSFDFDAGDEQKTSTSKKILYALLGLAAVILCIFLYFSSSTKPNAPVHDTEPSGSGPSTKPNHELVYESASSIDHTAHDIDEASSILTRLKKRLDAGKFSELDYRNMADKVVEMYPNAHIPPHLLLPPAPENNAEDVGGSPENNVEGEVISQPDFPRASGRGIRGKLKNLGSNLCMTSQRPFRLVFCENGGWFYYTYNIGRIQVLDGSIPPVCVEARTRTVHEGEIWTYPCHNDGGNQKWEYNHHTQMLTHLHGLCMAASPDSDPDTLPRVSVLPCDARLTSEQWIFEPDN